MTITISQMDKEDIEFVAKIHSEQFPRQIESLKWINCNFAAFPRILMFVAREGNKEIVGYIQWIQKSGFRQQVVIELEQIAVVKSNQGKGVGSLLIEQSLKYIKGYLTDKNVTLKAILVTTRTDNQAKALYENVLNAKEIAVIKNLYSHDEVIMLADVEK